MGSGNGGVCEEIISKNKSRIRFFFIDILVNVKRVLKVLRVSCVVLGASRDIGGWWWWWQHTGNSFSYRDSFS
jgi:hypothetical protein